MRMDDDEVVALVDRLTYDFGALVSPGAVREVVRSTLTNNPTAAADDLEQMVRVRLHIHRQGTLT